MTTQPKDLRAELASVLAEMSGMISYRLDVPHTTLCAWHARLTALTSHGGGGEAGVCLWSTAYGDENDMWESSCGIAFVFNDGGPEDNSFRFCHGCGKRIEVASDQAIPPTPSAPVGVEGWNIIPFTGSFKTSDERWEIYDPEGSGGAVNASDVRDPVVAKLLDALASRQAVQTNTSALLEEADSAVACSHNFATAKPDILPTEQEHILGLCRVVQKLRAALAGKEGAK